MKKHPITATTPKAADLHVMAGRVVFSGRDKFKENKTRISITEKDKDIVDEWYTRWSSSDKKLDLKDLEGFIKEITENYNHDYGTICHAIAAAAMAAAKCVDRSDQGGITGYQAGAVMWEFIRHWNHLDGPAALLQYKNLLYPQYEANFNTISAETWKWVQDEAAKNLAGTSHPVSQEMKDHWKSIIEGRVPAGLKVVND